VTVVLLLDLVSHVSVMNALHVVDPFLQVST